jgi:hypothetical protein
MQVRRRDRDDLVGLEPAFPEHHGTVAHRRVVGRLDVGSPSRSGVEEDDAVGWTTA